jgi:hypothetical protein
MANEFQYRGQLNGKENPVTLTVPVGNSDAVVVGRAVKLDTFSNGGGIIAATAGSKILGILVGLVDKYGVDLDNSNQSITGTWVTSTKTFTAASDNMTVDKVAGKVVVDKNSLWYNDAAGDLAQADELKFFDLGSAAQVGDQNGHDTAGAVMLMKRDPDGDADASKGIFKIAETQLEPYAQQ